ncbi:hypothetical protein MXM41_09630 [Leclercia adecarboxylata]|uniref:hypothetical protein n=1 Tax=Leclercia adecarboxylata TaxID=83655 RepID=UPI002DB77F19|nr:hypothetical protein [Leclercia adecarboxylata]MEB6379191.1 hypothetical protein [Leclercia adecarboxylata]
MMKYASDAPTVDSGINIAAFNIGNAPGAWPGGMALDKGYGFVSPLWAGALLSLLAFMVVIADSVNRGLKLHQVKRG